MFPRYRCSWTHSHVQMFLTHCPFPRPRHVVHAVSAHHAHISHHTHIPQAQLATVATLACMSYTPCTRYTWPLPTHRAMHALHIISSPLSAPGPLLESLDSSLAGCRFTRLRATAIMRRLRMRKYLLALASHSSDVAGSQRARSPQSTRLFPAGCVPADRCKSGCGTGRQGHHRA